MTGYEWPDDPETLRAVLSGKRQNGSDRMNVHDVHLSILKDRGDTLGEARKTQDERLARLEENTAAWIDIVRAGRGIVHTVKGFGKRLIRIGRLPSAIYAPYCAIINRTRRGI